MSKEPRYRNFDFGKLHFSIEIERLGRKYSFDWTCPYCGYRNDHPSIYDNEEDAIRWAEIGLRIHARDKHKEDIPKEETSEADDQS